MHDFKWHGCSKKANGEEDKTKMVCSINNWKECKVLEYNRYKINICISNSKTFFILRFSVLKVPGALNFNILRIIADQFYYNVHDVRTKDDTLLNVKLMIFFEIKVLPHTHER